MSSVCEFIAKSVMFIGTASEIWSQLETRFSLSNVSRKYKLSKDVFGISQQGVSVSEYYTKMKCIWEELDSLATLLRLTTISPELFVFLSAVEKQKEEQRLFQFLNGLDDCYSSQRSQLLLINPLPSVENTCAVIQQEESQKDVFNSGLPGRTNQPRPVQNQSRSVHKRTTANVSSGSNSFTFTSEQFENLMRNVLKDMKPGASSDDCTDDELEFVVGMICLNAATNNALFYWILDTGATNHMTPYCRDMINAKILEILPKITLPNGDSSEITQIGQVKLQNGIVLKDILCVPTFKFSLLPVPKLTKGNNCVAIFYPNLCVIQDLRTRKVHGLGRKIGGLYHLLNVPIDQVDVKLRMEVENSVNISLFSCSAGVYNKTMCPGMYSLWHHKLGYISVTKMKHVQCSDVPFVVFELIHMDTWGPYKVPTNGKFKYFLTIVDDFSRATWTYSMVHKFDALEIVKAFLKFMELQFSTKSKCIRSDNALEFVKGPCALIPSSVLNNKTPYEKLLNTVPDYSNLKVFGYFAVASNPLRVVDKFSRRGVPCVFIGYPAHQKGYKLYNLLTHASFVSRDVIFHEHIFPFAESSSQSFFQPLPVLMPIHPVVYDCYEPANTQNGPTTHEETVVPNTTKVPIHESVVPNTPEAPRFSVPTSSTTTNTEALPKYGYFPCMNA
ncbi:cysteine-rich receptor-like protein kinase 8 [Tanacetum coccineum]